MRSKVKIIKMGYGGEFLMDVVSVCGGVGTVEVRVGAVGETTVAIITHESGGVEAAPLVRHDLFDVDGSDVVVFADCIFPLME